MAPPRTAPADPKHAKRLERRRAMYAANRATIVEAARTYRDEHGDAVRERSRAQYAAMTPDERAAFLARRAELAKARRARLTPVSRHTPTDAERADAAARRAEAAEVAKAVRREERDTQRAALARERLARAVARLAAREAQRTAKVAHTSATAAEAAEEAAARWRAAEAHVLAVLTGRAAPA